MSASGAFRGKAPAFPPNNRATTINRTQMIWHRRMLSIDTPSMKSLPIKTVVFDSNCILCSRWVRFVLTHEATNHIHFASSRKPVGKALAAEFGLGAEQLDLTYLVISDGRALTKSDASLALIAELKAPWSWLGLLRLVPASLRDGLYDIVARNRLKWFGEEEDCFLPTPEQRGRFLD